MNHAISTEPAAVAPDVGQGRQIPTARNSERWMLQKPAAPTKYLPNQVNAARQEDRQEAIRKAIALRAASRLERDCQVAFTGSPYQRGIQQVLFQLHSVREAESIDALLVRERHLSGMIEGAYAFQGIQLRDTDLLHALRTNAFALRLQELRP